MCDTRPVHLAFSGVEGVLWVIKYPVKDLGGKPNDAPRKVQQACRCHVLGLSLREGKRQPG